MRKLLLMCVLVVGCFGAAQESRAQFCPGVSPWVFDDVLASDPFCSYITEMAARGVTLGCSIIDANHRLYCPTTAVPRNQMAAFLGRLADDLFPATCATGQVMKWDGTQWACANDNVGGGGGGTVTSVMAGTGLQGSPNPITGAGSLNLAASYQLPQACLPNQIPKWVANAWACAADAGGTGFVSSITAGLGLTGGIITTTGTIAADATYLQRRVGGTCAAGSSIRIVAADGTVTCQPIPVNAFVHGGNAFGSDAYLGTTDNTVLRVIVNNEAALRIMPTAPNAQFTAATPNLIGGWLNNGADPGVIGATIGGGGGYSSTIYSPNLAQDHYATIGGGIGNIAGAGTSLGTSDHATVGGGVNNKATGWSSFVGGGTSNTASGNYSAVGGGSYNKAEGLHASIAGGPGNTASGANSMIGGGANNNATGPFSSVLGGASNTATGNVSVAMGYRAKAAHNGTFVFADSSEFDFSTNVADNFRVRATGGVRFVVDIDGSGNTAWSCGLVSGGSWVCSSDRNQKQDFEQLDGKAVLDKVAAMPVYAWSPKGRNSHVRHYGPTAQDFHAAFGLGDTDLGIGQQDADGVALSAIQGLHRIALDQRDLIASQQSEIVRLADALAEMRRQSLVEITEIKRAMEFLLARSAPEGQLAAAR